MGKYISKSEMIEEMFIGTLKAVKVPKDYFLAISLILTTPWEQWELVKYIFNSDLSTLDLESILEQAKTIHSKMGEIKMIMKYVYH